MRRLPCEIMDCEIEEEKFLKRSASGKKKVQAIINEEKEFGVSFNCTTEEITFDFMEYGMNMAGLNIFRTHRKHNYSNNVFH